MCEPSQATENFFTSSSSVKINTIECKLKYFLPPSTKEISSRKLVYSTLNGPKASANSNSILI